MYSLQDEWLSVRLQGVRHVARECLSTTKHLGGDAVKVEYREQTSIVQRTNAIKYDAYKIYVLADF